MNNIFVSSIGKKLMMSLAGLFLISFLAVHLAILTRYGGERCTCVSMMDTYRARHAIRDVGAALGLPPGEIDAVAKAFPHIRASQVRAALRDLPELRASGLGGGGS